MKKETESVKKKRAPRSIRFHVFVSMLALAIGIVAIIWLFESIFLGQAYGYVKRNDIKHASSIITTNINSDTLPALIKQTKVEYDLCARVFVFDGDDITEKHEGEDFHHLNDCFICKVVMTDEYLTSLYKEAKEKDGPVIKHIPRDKLRDFVASEDFDKDASSEDTIISVSLVEDEGGLVNMVILNTSSMPLDSVVRTIRFLLGVLSLIVVAIAVLVAYLLAKYLTAPIVKMDNDARALASSNYQIKFEEKGPREVVDLAKTLNKTSNELESLDKMRKELIANISHDLRTPLTMISGYSEVMRDLPGENTPENMQVIIDETARLTSLVNDLLVVSKLQSGTQDMRFEKTSLTGAICETVKRYDTLVSHNGYKIEFIYEGEVFVLADETRLLQVVYNLINNAINYTGEDKRVTVKQEIEGDVVRISVTDTGEGISDEDLPLIWDRYYKVDKVHKRAMIGTGLGLSIVKNILLLHSSRFGVSSKLGEGSTFWFEFKILTDEEN